MPNEAAISVPQSSTGVKGNQEMARQIVSEFIRTLRICGQSRSHARHLPK